MMPHPLAHLDGKRKYLCSLRSGDDLEKLYLHVVTSRSSMKERKDVSAKLASVMHEAQLALLKQLESEAKTIKIKPQLDAEMVSCEFPKIFGDDRSNHTVFIIENEQGNSVCAIHLTINDQKKRSGFCIGNDIGTFIYVDDVITSSEYRGKGVLPAAFDKIITMFSGKEFCDDEGRKIALKPPIEFAVSMMVSDIVSSRDGEASKRIINLDLFRKIWTSRFGDALSLRAGWSDDSSQIVDSTSINSFDELEIDAVLHGIEERGRELVAKRKKERKSDNILAIRDGVEVCLSSVIKKSHEDLLRERMERFEARKIMIYQEGKYEWISSPHTTPGEE